MPQAPLSRKEAVRRIKAINVALKAGYRPRGLHGQGTGAISVAAEALNLPTTTIFNCLPRAKSLFGLEPDWKLWKQAPGVTNIDRRVDRSAQRQTDEIQALRDALKKAQRELNASEDLRASIFKLSETKLRPPSWAVKKETSATSPGVPILLFSDAQWGERIAANELDGINEFNVEIATRRYRYMISTAIDLCMKRLVKPSYPGMIYLRGGDMISGDIHQELRETNDLQSIPAVRSIVEQECWGIERLLENFGEVWVISVPGNHGRTTIKPFAKRYAQTNYDTLSAWMLESYFKARGEKRVHFWTPESGDALFKVYGWQFLMTHGDRIGSRGGQGFIGPSATIARGMKKVRDYYISLGTTIDTILVGHFHTRLELEYGFANGSLPGASEYARDGRMSPAAPSQWLLFVHPNHGVTIRWPIFLEKTPRIGPVASAPFKRGAS